MTAFWNEHGLFVPTRRGDVRVWYAYRSPPAYQLGGRIVFSVGLDEPFTLGAMIVSVGRPGSNVLAPPAVIAMDRAAMAKAAAHWLFEDSVAAPLSRFVDGRIFYVYADGRCCAHGSILHAELSALKRQPVMSAPLTAKNTVSENALVRALLETPA